MLKPRQLGVGLKGGSEALVHGPRRYLDNFPVGHVLVKLDFVNAFNSVRCEAKREAVPFMLYASSATFDSAYGATLRLGEIVIESAEGVQQGDPLGIICYYASSSILCNIVSEFVSTIS